MYFATVGEAVIAPGEVSVEVLAVCQTAGSAGNGIPAGALNIISNSFPYAVSCANLEATQGGADEDDDEEYRAKNRQSIGRLSPGTSIAYEFFAKEANSAVIDSHAAKTDPATVGVWVLLEGGEIPGTAVLAQVENYLRLPEHRGFTDFVEVYAPQAVDYNIDLTWYAPHFGEVSGEDTAQAVEGAISAYVQWQSSKLGRDINRDELLARIKAAGAKRAAITAPEYQVLTKTQVARLGGENVVFGGFEEE